DRGGRSARAAVLLVRARRHRAYARPRHGSRSGQRGLRGRDAAARRPDPPRLAGHAGGPLPRVIRRLALPLAALLLVAAGRPATETEHVVATGETLTGIANRAGVPLVVIAEANGLAQPYRIRIGQTLVIPRQRTHTVASGETGFAIAYKYGVSWRAIATANGL